MSWNEEPKKKRLKKVPQLGSLVLTAEGRTGRWVDITREGMAVIISGLDMLTADPGTLQLAFEDKEK